MRRVQRINKSRWWLPVYVWVIAWDCYIAATVSGAVYRGIAALGAVCFALLLGSWLERGGGR